MNNIDRDKLRALQDKYIRFAKELGYRDEDMIFFLPKLIRLRDLKIYLYPEYERYFLSQIEAEE